MHCDAAFSFFSCWLRSGEIAVVRSGANQGELTAVTLDSSGCCEILLLLPAANQRPTVVKSGRVRVAADNASTARRNSSAGEASGKPASPASDGGVAADREFLSYRHGGVLQWLPGGFGRRSRLRIGIGRPLLNALFFGRSVRYHNCRFIADLLVWRGEPFQGDVVLREGF